MTEKPTVSGQLRSLLERLPESLPELKDHPEMQRPVALRLFLDRVEDIRFENASDALSLIVEATSFFSAIPPFFKRMEFRELRCRICLIAGSIKRTLADFDHASLAYLCAHEDIKHGDMDPRFSFELGSRMALLRRDQRHFDEALNLATTGLKTARANGDQTWAPRLMVILANILVTMGRHEEGLARYQEALEILSPDDQNFYFAAVQSTAVALCALKTSPTEQISAWLEKARAVENKLPNSNHQLHLTWLEAFLAQRNGDTTEAEKKLRKVRQGFLSTGMLTFSCAITMDLALLYLENGQPNKAMQLSADIFSMLKGLRIHRDAIAALKLYIESAASSCLTTSLVETIRTQILKCPSILEH